jgi:hypothetical protein
MFLYFHRKHEPSACAQSAMPFAFLNMSELPLATRPEVSLTVMRRSILACKAASSPSWQERHGGEFGRLVAGAAAPAQLQSRAGNCIVRPNQTGFLGA